MVNTVHEEVQKDEGWRVWKEFVDVEQEPVHDIFKDGPDDIPYKEACNCLCESITRNEADEGNRQCRLFEEAGQRRRKLE